MLVQDSQIMHQVMKHNMHNNSRIESLVLDSLFIFTVLSTVLHVTVISIERLVAVAFPIKYNSFTTLGCKIFSLLFMWLAPLLLAPLFTYLQVYGIDQKYKYGNIIRPTILFVCCFIVFFGYMFLVIALLRRDWRLKQMIPREVRKATRDRRTTLICLFIGLAFVCCVIPYALGNVSIELYNPFFNLLITLNHGINPLLYFLKAWLDKRRRGPSHSSSPNIPDIQALVSTRSERTLSNITSSTSCIEKGRTSSSTSAAQEMAQSNWLQEQLSNQTAPSDWVSEQHNNQTLSSDWTMEQLSNGTTQLDWLERNSHAPTTTASGEETGIDNVV